MGRIVRFKALLFDVGDTLLHVPGDSHKRALESVAHLGQVALTEYKAAIARAQSEWQAAGGLPEHEDLSETWVAHTMRALEMLEFSGDTALAATLIEHSFLKDGWVLYADASDVLAQLQHQGFRLGVVSNWPPSLEATLEAVGLRDYFEVVVASGVVGYAKPHPQIFRMALNEMGVEPGDTLFVGDKLNLDIEGAAAVGMHSVLIDRHGRMPEHQNRIASLRELLAYVA